MPVKTRAGAVAIAVLAVLVSLSVLAMAGNAERLVPDAANR